jgi:hypothetical protein
MPNTTAAYADARTRRDGMTGSTDHASTRLSAR